MIYAPFHPEALVEFREQAIYYNERSPGLGVRFVEQIENAVKLAASMPSIGSPYKYGTRRVFPRNFPHSVIYREHDGKIVIVAIAHFRRKPGYWLRRR